MKKKITEEEKKKAAGEVEDLCRQLLEKVPEDVLEKENERGRPRLIQSMLLWGALLVTIIKGESWLRQVWRQVTYGLWGLKPVKVSDGAIYKRVKGDAWETMQKIFYSISHQLTGWFDTTRGGLALFAENILTIDDTTLDKIAKKTGWLKKVKWPETILAGRMSSLFDVRTGQFVEVDITTDENRNEKIGAWKLLEKVKAGTMLLFDLGYFGFEWLDELTDRSIHYVTRLREKTSYIVEHVYYDTGKVYDAVVWLGKYRADQAKHAVRLVTVTYKGKKRSYITNVLDPFLLPVEDVVRLYAKRWDIETAFLFIKRVLKLHVIWSARPDIIKLQIYATLAVSQMYRAIKRQLAVRAGVPDDYISDILLPKVIPDLMKRHDANPLDIILNAKHGGGVIRPPRKKKFEIPKVDKKLIVPLPETIALVRTPRYARKNGRNCGTCAN
jgi:hypothetical protein